MGLGYADSGFSAESLRSGSSCPLLPLVENSFRHGQQFADDATGRITLTTPGQQHFLIENDVLPEARRPCQTQ